MERLCLHMTVCRCVVSDLADVVDEQVAFLTQDSRCVDVLLGEQVEPQCEAVHHGQAQHPQKLQHVQDPLHRIAARTCNNSRCDECVKTFK